MADTTPLPEDNFPFHNPLTAGDLSDTFDEIWKKQDEILEMLGTLVHTIYKIRPGIQEKDVVHFALKTLGCTGALYKYPSCQLLYTLMTVVRLMKDKLQKQNAE
jgi:hypothetical protein